MAAYDRFYCTKPISPSARVEDVSVKTGLPAFKAAVKLGHFSDSAPCNVQIRPLIKSTCLKIKIPKHMLLALKKNCLNESVLLSRVHTGKIV